MPTTPDLMTPRDDPSLRVPSERLTDAKRERAAAQAQYDALPPLLAGATDVDLDRLEATRRLKRTHEAVAAAQHLLDVARGMAQTRWLATRTTGRRDHLHTVLVTTEAAVAAVRALRDYDGETATAVGQIPGEATIAPLLGLDEALRRLRRELDGPAPAPPPPPVPAGLRRVRILARFEDSQHIWHYPTHFGTRVGPEDLDEKDAEVAIEKGWAVEVPV